MFLVRYKLDFYKLLKTKNIPLDKTEKKKIKSVQGGTVFYTKF